jgi:hypothetical protein
MELDAGRPSARRRVTRRPHRAVTRRQASAALPSAAASSNTFMRCRASFVAASRSGLGSARFAEMGEWTGEVAVPPPSVPKCEKGTFGAISGTKSVTRRRAFFGH